MTRALTHTPLGPTLRIEGPFDRDSVTKLAALLEHLASAARLLIDFSRARDVDPAALVQACELVSGYRSAGRDIALHGLTLGQWRLLELVCAPGRGQREAS